MLPLALGEDNPTALLLPVPAPPVLFPEEDEPQAVSFPYCHLHWQSFPKPEVYSTVQEEEE